MSNLVAGISLRVNMVNNLHITEVRRSSKFLPVLPTFPYKSRTYGDSRKIRIPYAAETSGYYLMSLILTYIYTKLLIYIRIVVGKHGENRGKVGKIGT